MSRRNWNRITRLEQAANDATPPKPCRVCIGEPSADDLACGLELIQIAVVDGRVTKGMTNDEVRHREVRHALNSRPVLRHGEPNPQELDT